MAEKAPIARSPIAPAPPVGVKDGWEVSERRTSAPLRIADCSFLDKLLVKGSPHGGVADALGVSFGRATRDRGVLIVGSAPGEWMLLAAPGQVTTAERLVTELPGGDLVGCFDVTHGGAVVRVTGREAPAMLAKVCAVDLSEDVTPDGAAFRSSVAKVVTDVVRDDHEGQRSFLLHCERSLGQYLFDALLDAGTEFRIEIDGFVGVSDTRSE